MLYSTEVERSQFKLHCKRERMPTRRLLVAVVHALRKWRHYLQGVLQFTVMTDHQALKWLMSFKEPKGRLARWMMDIQDYDL